MAHSFASVPTSETDLLALDKPIVAAWATRFDAMQWKDALDFTSGTNLLDAAFPVANSLDGKTNLITQPNTSTPPLYLLFDFTANPIEFDFIAVVNHNLGKIATPQTMNFFVADDDAFSVSLRDGTGFGPAHSPADNDRVISLDLRHSGSPSVPQRYSNVQFCALQFTGLTSIPFVGEIVWGRRRQLQLKPNVPWGPDNLDSEVNDFVSQAGVISRYVKHKGKRVISANVNPFEDPFRQDIIDLFEASEFGTQPFVWIEDPSTSPRKFNLMMQDNPSLQYPLVGPFERNWQFIATEQGPDFLSAEF